MTATTRALVALTGAYTLSQFFRTYIAVIAPELSRDLSLGPSEFGWLSSVLFLSFAAAQIPIGIAFDRYGVGRPSTMLMGVGVVSALAFAGSPHAALSMVAQAGLGLACAPLYMGLIYYAARRLDEHRYVQVISIAGAFGAAGALLAAAPLGWATQWIGWRGAVAASAVLALIATLGLRSWVNDRPEEPAPPESFGQTVSSCLAVFRTPGIWPLIPVCLTLAAGTAFRNAWGGPYLADVFGLDALARGEAMTIVSLFALVAAFSLAFLVKRWTPKQVAIGWLIVGIVVSLLAAAMPATNVSFSIFAMALLFGVANIHPLVMAQARGLLDARMRGRGLGILNAFVFIGTAAISAGFGKIIAFSQTRDWTPATGYGGLFLTTALLLGAGLFFYRRSNR